MANKKRRCTFCKEYREADQGMVLPIGFFCNSDHAYQYAKAKTDKAREKQARQVKRESAIVAKADRKQHRERKVALRPKAWYLADTQKYFNKFIRLRDAEDECISCDRTIEEIEKNDNWKVGGSWDCGHYLTRGAYPELRFEELNAHKQCKSCNAGAGKFVKKARTVTAMYRLKLIRKIGEDNVMWVEGYHEPKKYDIEDLKQLTAVYKAKIKEIENRL